MTTEQREIFQHRLGTVCDLNFDCGAWQGPDAKDYQVLADKLAEAKRCLCAYVDEITSK